MRNLFFPLLLLVAFAAISNAQEAAEIPEENSKKRIPISPETTYITKPVTEDGLVDYQAYLNAYLQQDVRTEENAAVDYLKVIGNHEQVCSDPEFFKQLTILIGTDPFDDSDLFLKDFYEIYLERSGGKDVFLEYRDYPEHRVALKIAWKREDHPIVGEWLQRNQKAIENIIVGTTRSENFSPLLNVNEERSATYLVPIDVIYHPKFAAILRIHATLALGTQKIGDAVEAALAIHRLSRQTSPRSALEGIHASAEVSLNAFLLDVQVANSDTLSAEDLRKYLEDRLRLNELAGFHQGLLVERLIHLNTFQRAVTHDPIRDSREQFTWELMGLSNRDKLSAAYAHAMIEQLDVHQFMKEINEFYNRLESGLKLKTYQRRKESLHDFLQSYTEELDNAERIEQSPLSIFQTPDQKISNLKAKMFGTKARNFINSHDLMSSAMTVDKLSILGIALALHEREMGSFPKTIGELSPKYLTRVPNDPITGKPYKYRVEKDQAIIYSIGYDLQDDGGETAKIIDNFALEFLGYEQQYDLVFPIRKSNR